MTDRRPTAAGDAGDIRARAEQRLRSCQEGAPPRADADVLRLLHELEVHQL